MRSPAPAVIDATLSQCNAAIWECKKGGRVGQALNSSTAANRRPNFAASRGRARQVRAADSFRKTEIVFDLGTGAGLAAHGETLDQHRLQAFRSAVNGGAQPRGTGALDRQIIFGPRRIAELAELLGDLAYGRPLHVGAVGEDADRLACASSTRQAQAPAGRSRVNSIQRMDVACCGNRECVAGEQRACLERTGPACCLPRSRA